MGSGDKICVKRGEGNWGNLAYPFFAKTWVRTGGSGLARLKRRVAGHQHQYQNSNLKDPIVVGRVRSAGPRAHGVASVSEAAVAAALD